MTGRWHGFAGGAAMRCAIVLAVVLGGAIARGQATMSLSVDAEALHADMPFVLTLTAKGFEEEPVPEAPDVVIDGCAITFLGASPNVSSHVQIVNGRRSEWREVTFNYRWRVVAAAAGRYTVPALRLEQGSVAATSRAAAFNVTDVASTQDMIVRMRLPERPLWVGETFDAAVEWLLAREVENYEFAVPLFDLDGAQVEAPPATGQTVRFTAGSREIDLPLERARISEGGREYTRFTFPARVTLNRARAVDLDPVRVVARLEAGTVRDGFGFRRPRYELFRATGERRRVAVRPLPQAGRPATFVNAIGGGFSIDVQASRTVVAVGDPIELTLRLRGDVPLSGISLPPLSHADALPPAHFSVPEGSLAGEIDAATGSKRFRVTVRVKSAEVGEIPPIAFSYFEPSAGEYRTVASEPIALAVDAAQLVSVDDVVAAPVPQPSPAAESGAGVGGVATLIGADLSLSAPSRTFATPWGSGGVGVLLGILYGVPALVALGSFWLARTGGRRARNREVRRAFTALERALDGGGAARDAAPVIGAAMRRLAQAASADLQAAAPALARLETHAFDPAAARQGIADDVREELRTVARSWATHRGFRASGAAALVATLALLSAGNAGATTANAMDEARGLFQSALAETDRLRRVRAFARAEQALRPIAAANPSAPAVQVDWGNAALAAQDAGRAVLAYRRALRAAPGHARARVNLTWVRGHLPMWLPRPVQDTTLDALLFWRGRLTPAQLLVAGASAFAGGVLLLAVWSRRRARPLAALSVPLWAVWLVATASALLADNDAGSAVVLVDSAVLRAADSAGASPAFANPLPAGTEVTITQTRQAWVRVALADGTSGWLAASAVEAV